MPWPISALPYPFELGFMQRALVAGIAVGVFAPMIGTFLVQKRMSLIGDGIGHVAFAGVGAGLIAGIWPIWTALAFAVGGALGIEWLRSRRKASGDLALALFFYSGIALGVVLVSLGGGLNASLLTYLFGQPLTVNDSELVVILTLGFVIVLSMLALRRGLVPPLPACVELDPRCPVHPLASPAPLSPELVLVWNSERAVKNVALVAAAGAA